VYPDRMIQPGKETVLKIGNETVHLRNMGPAHSWNDVIVYLENRRFLMTGDIVFNHMHPVMITKGGTNAASWNNVLDSLMIHYDNATVLPGHGALSDKQALKDMKEYFTSIREGIDNPEKMKAVKEKYKSYSGIPVLTSINKTMAFFENEKKDK